MLLRNMAIALVLVSLVVTPFVVTQASTTTNTLLSLDLNSPPTRPTLTGTTSGETGTAYTYTAVSTDPDGDQISYCFDWDDGSSEFCTPFLPSGQTATATHTWSTDGDYTITVRAKDDQGAESEPATLRVTMPKT